MTQRVSVTSGPHASVTTAILRQFGAELEFYFSDSLPEAEAKLA